MKMNVACEACLLGKYLNKYPPDASEREIDEYQRALRRIIEDRGTLSAPEVVEKFEIKYRELFGPLTEFTRVKGRFNDLMLSYEKQLTGMIESADDPFKMAVQYAMAGNFIDFGALKSVCEDKLVEFLNAANKAKTDENVLERLKNDIRRAKKLVYFLDNCGEIVADKIFMQAIRKYNPELHITAVVRGRPVLNDVTEDDARQVKLYDAAHKVIPNGCGVAGNVLTRVSEQTLNEVNGADVLISKGQGNFESLCGCGLNVYYIFMCKCDLFVDRFGVSMFDGILTSEQDIPEM